jgi:hypothetical protein
VGSWEKYAQRARFDGEFDRRIQLYGLAVAGGTHAAGALDREALGDPFVPRAGEPVLRDVRVERPMSRAK